MRKWTEEERRKQSELTRTQQPWKHSTGPRTPEGKSKSARNAYRHGFRSRDVAEIRALLRAQRLFMKKLLAQTLRKKIKKKVANKLVWPLPSLRASAKQSRKPQDQRLDCFADARNDAGGKFPNFSCKKQ